MSKLVELILWTAASLMLLTANLYSLIRLVIGGK